MNRTAWIIQQFSLTWGVAVTRGTLFDAEVPEDVILTEWDEQLHAFSDDVIRKAVQSAKDSGKDFPPKLPVFKAICADFRRSEVPPVEALPPPAVDREIGRAALDMINGAIDPGDPMFWAKRPKSAAAVDLIVRGIQRDPTSKLKDILAGHLADIDRAPVRSEEARQRLREIKGAA